MSQEWYYAKGDQKRGPITLDQLRGLARSGELAPSDLVWTEGMADWQQANSLKDLMPPTRSTPPPLKATAPVKPTPVTAKIDDAVGGVVGPLSQQPWYCHWAFLTLTLLVYPVTIVLVWWKSTYSKPAKWAWTVAACFMAAIYLSNKPAKDEAPSIPQASAVKPPEVSAKPPVVSVKPKVEQQKTVVTVKKARQPSRKGFFGYSEGSIIAIPEGVPLFRSYSNCRDYAQQRMASIDANVAAKALPRLLR